MTTSPMVVRATAPSPQITSSAQMSAPPGNNGSGIGLGSISPPLRESPRREINDASAIFGKRHGRSSGMRHGWRSSWSGVRFPVRLSVQGPVGEVPATAPFSIPLHHRYRRWIGGVSRPHRFLSGGKVCLFFTVMSLAQGYSKKQSPSHNTPAAARSTTGAACAAGTASPPHIPPQRGIEPSSSGQRPAALPLRYTTKSPHYAPLLTGTLCLNGWYEPEAGLAAPSQPHYRHSVCSQMNEIEPNTHTHH